MEYYAHSLPGRPEAEWEPLARHLAEVADGAGRRGRRFGAEALAALAGLVHDLGKMIFSCLIDAGRSDLRCPG